MRTKVVILFLLLSSMLCAQKHGTFEGVEINGSIEHCVDELTARGYKLVKSETEEGTFWLEGKFNGRNVKLSLWETPISHEVFAIIVSYESYKLSRAEKYSLFNELFGWYSSNFKQIHKDVDGKKLDERSVWFRANNLLIRLCLTSVSDRLYVSVVYYDVENREKEKKESQTM